MEVSSARTILQVELPLDLARTLLPLARRSVRSVHSDRRRRRDLGERREHRSDHRRRGSRKRTRASRSNRSVREQRGRSRTRPGSWVPNDDPTGFEPTGKLAAIHRANPGIRITRTKAGLRSGDSIQCASSSSPDAKRSARSRSSRENSGRKLRADRSVDSAFAEEDAHASRTASSIPRGSKRKRALTLREVARTAKVDREDVGLASRRGVSIARARARHRSVDSRRDRRRGVGRRRRRVRG